MERKLTPSEIEGIFNVYNIYKNNAYDNQKEQIMETIAKSFYYWIYHKIDNVIVGIASYRLDTHKICNVIVLPKFRNRTIGTCMVNELIRIFDGKTKLEVDKTKETWPHLLQWYQKLGFVVYFEDDSDFYLEYKFSR